MKKRIILHIICSLLILSFFACSKKETYVLKELRQETILYSQLETIHKHEKVVDLLNQQVSMQEFAEKLGVYTYKSVKDIPYFIIKTSNGLFKVTFDSAGQHSSIRKIKFSTSANLKSVEKLTIGMTLTDVQAADSEGQYDFLLSGRSDFPQISYHFFESGDAFCITYENEVVTQIVHFTL